MTERLVEFDYLRGLSIFLVVWGHMGILLGEYEFMLNGSAQFSKMITFTVQGTTAVFVFISGFMFYWVYYRRGFQYKPFLLKKYKNIFHPYFYIVIIFSLIHLLYGVYTGRLAEWNFWISNEFERFLLNTFMYWSFWYIPFIAVVFILSHVYLKFLETRFKLQIIILFCAFIVSCLLARHNTNPFLNCIYFSLYYFFGIVCAQNYERIQNFSVKFWLRLLCLYVVTILFLAIKGYFIYGAVRFDISGRRIIMDLNPVFKVPECLLLLWISYKLANISDTLKSILSTMAKYSFAIFFLHNLFIAIIEEFFFWKVGELPLQDSAWLYPVGFAIAIIVCTICIFIAKFLKEKIGANSRIYIGV